ncbi:Rv3235 family protein [Streptomyces sp. NPDC020607]|uniref:Rv3235 family protein n=1 Tax=Streptomyces sp. NPDC020607 TaxID=3365082 RepID=UPI003798E12A
MRKVMTRPRPRPTTTRPPGGRPPTRKDSRTPALAPTPNRTPTHTPAPPAPPAPRLIALPAPPAPPRTIPPQPPPHPTEIFAERLVLVLSGQRPMHWVARHIANTAFDELARLAELRPLCTDGHRPTIHRIGHYQPHPETYEVFARIATGPKLRALAFRLTLGADRKWRCTAVETGAPTPSRT